jgi:hypothetical protein
MHPVPCSWEAAVATVRTTPKTSASKASATRSNAVFFSAAARPSCWCFSASSLCIAMAFCLKTSTIRAMTPISSERSRPGTLTASRPLASSCMTCVSSPSSRRTTRSSSRLEVVTTMMVSTLAAI